MRRIALLGLVLLAGCQNIVGPLQSRSPMRVDDPRLPTFEQERRERDRLALPDNSPLVAPSSPGLLPGSSPLK